MKAWERVQKEMPTLSKREIINSVYCPDALFKGLKCICDGKTICEQCWEQEVTIDQKFLGFEN